jgi:hypothetical protein
MTEVEALELAVAELSIRASHVQSCWGRGNDYVTNIRTAADILRRLVPYCRDEDAAC